MKTTSKRYSLLLAGATIAACFASAGALAGGLLDVDFFDDVTFSAPVLVDNPYWPLNPDGTPRVFTYEAETEDGCIVDRMYVNSGPPGGPVAGLKALSGDYAFLGPVLEVLDIEWIDEACDGNLAEAELTFDWYAQDDFQNVWYMGEATRDFGDVEIDGEDVPCPTLAAVPLGTPPAGWPSPELYAECTAGSWEAGIEGGEGEDAVVGRPGIIVPGDMPFGPAGDALENGAFYLQEVAFGAEDMAKVLKTSTSLDEFVECRKVKEWNPFSHGNSVEHKWYCKDGRGLELIESIGGGRTETEELVSVAAP